MPEPLRIPDPEPDPPALREDNPFEARMYGIAEVAEILSVSRATLYRMMNDGRIPPALKFKAIGPRWPGRKLQQWYERAAAEAEAERAAR